MDGLTIALVIKTNFIGIPAERIPAHDPTEGLIWSYAVQILYNPILALVKSSVLIFLARIFGQKDWVRRFLLWLNVVNISQMVGVLFAIILQCTPVAFNWDLTIPGGHCVDRRVLYLLTAAFNILTDILIMGLPLWIFWGLRIPKRTKIALVVIFALGLLYVSTRSTVCANPNALQGNHYIDCPLDPACSGALQHSHISQLL